MKLSCTKENLHQGLAITSHISTKNVNLPILNNVLLKADGGGLKLISTNLEIAITCSIRGKVEQQGEYTVPSKLFFDYVNLCPDERVDIDLVDNALSVSCGSSKTKINGIVSTEFPLVPPASDGQSYTVSAANFSRALSQTLFSAATNESRPELSGVFLSFNNPVSGKGSLTLAATDSYRLSEAVIKLSEASDDQKDVIVPQRTLSELNRVFSVFKDDVEAPELVAVVVTDNQVVFRYGGVEITSRTLEGPYPDYKQIIPEKTQTQVIIEKQDLQKAIKTASLFSKTGLFDIYLKTNVGEQSLVTSANDVSRGENSVTLASMIDGADNEIALNFRYLLDGVNAIRAEKVVCSMIDKASPCVITPFESPEEKYQYIVMPIRQ